MNKKTTNQLDLPETTINHGKIIKQKFYLRNLYLEIYNQFKKSLKKAPKGKIIELGSGGGFIKEIIPIAITSDIMKLPDCDMTFSASKMPFKHNSVSAFLMLNTLHHIKDPEKAFKEMERCLKPGGKIVMIEPYNSFWSRFIYQHFHHETFDPEMSGWKITESGPLSGANGALPWIIFERDLQIFNSKFPNLKVTTLKPHTPFRYLLSGGLSVFQLLPDFTYKPVTFLEKKLSGLNRKLGMFVTVELKKIS